MSYKHSEETKIKFGMSKRKTHENRRKQDKTFHSDCLECGNLIINRRRKDKKKFCNHLCYWKYMKSNQHIDIYRPPHGWNIGLTKEDHPGIAQISEAHKDNRVLANYMENEKEGLKRRIRLSKMVKSRRKNGDYGLGLSFEPYCPEFNEELKQQVHIRDGNACIICFDFDVKLNTHHIDYNKKNSKKNNLITLCDLHHGKTNSNREFWTKFFKFNYGALLYEN